MKTLSAAAETERTSAVRKVRTVIEFDWARAGTWTGKYSDQPLEIGEDTYEAYVQSWGALKTSLDMRSLGSIDDLQITFKVDRTENFHTIYSAYNPEGTPVRFGVWFKDAAAAGIVWQFFGEVNTVQDVSVDGVKFDIVQFGLTKNKNIPELEISRVDFPDAPDESIGKRAPLIYGAVEKVPAIPVTAGRSTELYGSHGADDTTIRVYSVKGFPASGTIKIDDEKIEYGALDAEYTWFGETVAAFLECSRQAGGTEKAIHQHGATVLEVVPETVFLVAGHPCKSISAVRVGGQIAQSGVVTDTNDTTLVDGRALATITFAGEPTTYEVARSAQETRISPDSEGEGNLNPDYAKTYDEIEANTFALVTSGTSPLVVARGASADLGELISTTIANAVAVVLVEPDKNFHADNINLDVFHVAAPGGQRRSYLRLNAAQAPAEGYVPWQLMVYLNSVPTTGTIACSQSLAIFDETTVTWNNQPGLGTLLDARAVTATGWVTFSLPATADLQKGVVLWTNDAWAYFTNDESSPPPYFMHIAERDYNTEMSPLLMGGSLLHAHAAIEFAALAAFDPGDLQWRIEHEGLDMDWIDLWDPKYGHERPATDTVERDISQNVADVDTDADTPIYSALMNTYQLSGSPAGMYFSDGIPPGFAVDTSWNSAFKAVKSPTQTSGKTPFQIIVFRSNYTPPAGAITKIRFKWRATAEQGAAKWKARFYINDVLKLDTSWIYDGARNYSDWQTYTGDMEQILTHPNTRIECWTDNAGFSNRECYLYMVGIEVMYTPAVGSSTSGTALTATNYLNLITANVLDASTIEDPWEWFAGARIAVRNQSFAGEFRVYNLCFQVEYLPIETRAASDSGGQIEITADVEGIEDVGDGTGALIENPADIIEHIMIELLGFEASELDSTSFGAAWTALEELGARFGCALLEARDAFELIAEIAYQARSWWRAEASGAAGVYKLDVRAALLGVADRALGPSGVTGRLPGTGKLIPLGRAGIWNRIIVKYNLDYSRDEDDEPFADSARAEDEQSQSDVGVKEKIVEAFAIRDAVYAQNFANYLIAQEARPRELYSLKTSISNVELERGDIIAATDARWGMAGALGELVGVSYIPGAATQSRPHALELVVYLQPYVWTWSESGAEQGDPGEAGIIIVGTTTGETGTITGGSDTGGIIGTIRPSENEAPRVAYRAPQTGPLWIRGSFYARQTLPAAASSPVCWDAVRERWQYSFSDGTTVFEIDRAGNWYSIADKLERQSLTFAGVINSIECDATTLWFNAGNTRKLEVRADGYIRLPREMIERPWVTYLM